MTCARIAILALAAWSALAATTISDVIYTPSGVLFSGRMTYRLSRPITTAGGISVQPVTESIVIANGVLGVALEPNIGAQPENTWYSVQFIATNGVSFQQTWVVPTSGTVVKLHQVIRSAGPSTASSFAPWQLQRSGAENGQALVWTEGGWAPRPFPSAGIGVGAGVFEKVMADPVASIVIGAAEHGWSTANIVIECYDQTGQRVETAREVVDIATRAVTISFVPNLAGRCWLRSGLAGRTVGIAVTAQASVSWPNVGAELGGGAVLWRIYDQTGARVEPGQAGIDAAGTFTAAFSGAFTGRVVLVAQ